MMTAVRYSEANSNKVILNLVERVRKRDCNFREDKVLPLKEFIRMKSNKNFSKLVLFDCFYLVDR